MFWVFSGFIQMIETQYETQVYSVGSHNTLELNFTELYLNKGIKSYHSSFEIPKQNSAVERNHHLLNIVRALMFQSGVSLEYWRWLCLNCNILNK